MASKKKLAATNLNMSFSPCFDSGIDYLANFVYSNTGIWPSNYFSKSVRMEIIEFLNNQPDLNLVADDKQLQNGVEITNKLLFVSRGGDLGVFIYLKETDSGVTSFSGEDDEENDNGGVSVHLVYNINDSKHLTLLDAVKKHSMKDKLEKKIGFLCHSNYFYTKSKRVPSPVIQDLDINYGEGFSKIYQKTVDFFNSNETGLVLFHGEVGSGKTTVIRYLISNINKKMIYVPPALMESFSSPEFMTFLMTQKNIVLIIEDAENIVKSREEHSGAGVSNLLNITDGILGSSINIKVLCTFNAKIDSIDPALKRKGRLVLEHYFGKLPVETANKFLALIGKSAKVEEPMTLSDLYNIDKDNHAIKKEKGKIGFAK